MVTVDELLSQITQLQTQLESLNKKPNFFQKFGRLLIELIILCTLLQTYFPFKGLALFFSIIDSYLRLIFVSWPAVVLILGCFTLFRHREALDSLVGRVTEFYGVKLYTPNQSSITPLEIAKGQIEEEQDIGVDSEISDPASKIEILEKENVKLKENFVEENKKRLFERIYGLIYGSQINILSKLSASNGSMSVVDISQIYIDVFLKNTTLKEYSFNDYLSWLRNANLINFVDPLAETKTISITEEGKQFLAYIVSEKLDLNKPL